MAQLCDLFSRARAVDQECSRLNSEALSGEHRRLLAVELKARDLDNFALGSPSLIGTVKLPDWGTATVWFGRRHKLR